MVVASILTEQQQESNLRQKYIVHQRESSLRHIVPSVIKYCYIYHTFLALIFTLIVIVFCNVATMDKAIT